MTQALVVSFAPGVNLAVFGEGHGKLAAAANLHDVQILQLLHQFGSLTAVAAPSAQFTVVSVPPGPDLTCRHLNGRIK